MDEGRALFELLDRTVNGWTTAFRDSPLSLSELWERWTAAGRPAEIYLRQDDWNALWNRLVPHQRGGDYLMFGGARVYVL